MKMVDVDEKERTVKVPPPKKVPKINEDEFIKKSLQSMANGAPLVNNDTQEVIGSNYWPINNLPSKCRLYKEGTQITGRPLKVLEVKKLSSLNDSNADFVINDVIRKSIRGITVEELFVSDKMAIILWLRSNSFRDPSYIVPFKCDKCSAESSYHFDINENIDIKYLSDSYNPNDDVALRSGDKIKIKFLTVGDINKVERFKDVNKNAIGEFDNEMLTIAAMITELNGEHRTLMECYDFICNVTPEDFSYVVSYIDKFGMGIKPEMTVTCTKCGGQSLEAVTFQPSFFFPSYKFD